MRPDYTDAIKHGRAMVRLIEAVNMLLPGTDEREAGLLFDLKIEYQQRLRNLVADLPDEVSTQIFAQVEIITGLVGDSTLN